jgi:hypothetical protein
MTRVFKVRRAAWKAPDPPATPPPAGDLGGQPTPTPRLWRKSDPEVAPCTTCKRTCKWMRICPECSIKGCDVCMPMWSGRFCPTCVAKCTNETLNENACPPESRESY